MTTTRKPKTLPRLEYPSLDQAAIWEQAHAQAKAEADAISDDDLRGVLRGDDVPPVFRDLPADKMIFGRAWYQQRRESEIAHEIADAACASIRRDFAARAMQAVADAYGIPVADLTPAKAAQLVGEAWETCRQLGRTELRYQADPAAQRRARAAETRAHTQMGRLEDYLQAAGLIACDEGVVIAGDGA
jgi:hypothetical protein